MRHITMITYSPDGAAKAFAETLAEHLSDFCSVIDLTVPSMRTESRFFSRDELLMFAAPSKMGRLPKTAEGVFRNIYANDTPGIFLITFENHPYGDALLELAQIAEDQGVVGIGAAALPVVRANENSLTIFAKRLALLLREIDHDPEYVDSHTLKVKGHFPYCEYENAALMQTLDFSTKEEYFLMHPSCTLRTT